MRMLVAVKRLGPLSIALDSVSADLRSAMPALSAAVLQSVQTDVRHVLAASDDRNAEDSASSLNLSWSFRHAPDHNSASTAGDGSNPLRGRPLPAPPCGRKLTLPGVASVLHHSCVWPRDVTHTWRIPLDRLYHHLCVLTAISTTPRRARCAAVPPFLRTRAATRPPSAVSAALLSYRAQRSITLMPIRPTAPPRSPAWLHPPLRSLALHQRRRRRNSTRRA